ncbi:mannitol dehydrogenase family protein [Sphingomonas sanguinis]|uniref:Mannitol dehydrogenase family protein n=1 Tax=Sphingomonas sanguinis TaxID=33051 RepID=A0A7Y7QW12_9SPHN|nr:mannitol dehydrogenase family protein [Sphingomonas sanguinis]MBZ6382423.1 mannitol dehydrogenase family protein [Sphingomonas sanguinis]NNG50614.1 mannitol dehydrogenase family protein [Sphingomonas sanguinis]NNG54692.1 mannitol dehydrogenase family protein [Sphingomonas sanguinis]NVP31721.1 mannitol dehydrogenase family protein [Sphingomonas sanguinis]
MTRLSEATAAHLPAGVSRPGYDRASQRIGIVHLGLGAFHRAHQAVYTDDAMAAGDRDWAIAGASLRSAGVHDQMAPQDGLYTVTERSSEGESVRLIGAIREVTVAAKAPERLAALLAAADTRIVTLTVTEKGYWRRPDGATDLAGIVADGNSIYHHLARAVVARQAAGLAPLTLVSCDNLPDNGRVLRAGVAAFLNHQGETAARGWFERDWRCPNTMVDRIVPAVTDGDRARVEAVLGMRDEAAVVTEPYRQWVIEDDFAGDRPRWELGGAQFVADVAPYETAKLRMLNGAHSALAYLGLERGHRFVHEAVADPAIRPVVERLMRQEAATSFTAAEGQQLDPYADALLARFANVTLEHRLSQIASDGSQKVGPRWLSSLAAHGGDAPATLTALAAWLRFIRTGNDASPDPRRAELARLWAQGDAGRVVDALFGAGGSMAGLWQPTEVQRQALVRAIEL